MLYVKGLILVIACAVGGLSCGHARPSSGSHTAGPAVHEPTSYCMKCVTGSGSSDPLIPCCP